MNKAIILLCDEIDALLAQVKQELASKNATKAKILLDNCFDLKNKLEVEINNNPRFTGMFQAIEADYEVLVDQLHEMELGEDDPTPVKVHITDLEPQYRAGAAIAKTKSPGTVSPRGPVSPPGEPLYPRIQNPVTPRPSTADGRTTNLVLPRSNIYPAVPQSPRAVSPQPRLGPSVSPRAVSPQPRSVRPVSPAAPNQSARSRGQSSQYLATNGYGPFPDRVVPLVYAVAITPEQQDKIQRQMQVLRITQGQSYTSCNYYKNIGYLSFNLSDLDQLRDLQKAVSVINTQTKTYTLAADSQPMSVSIVITKTVCEDLVNESKLIEQSLANFLKDLKFTMNFDLAEGPTPYVKYLKFTKLANETLDDVLDHYNRLFYMDEDQLQLTIHCPCGKCVGNPRIQLLIAPSIKAFVLYGPFKSDYEHYSKKLKEYPDLKIRFVRPEIVGDREVFRVFCYAEGSPDIAWNTITLKSPGVDVVQFVAVETTCLFPAVLLEYKHPLPEGLRTIPKLGERSMQLCSLLMSSDLFKSRINAAIIMASGDIILECLNENAMNQLIKKVTRNVITSDGISIDIFEVKPFVDITKVNAETNILKDKSITDARPGTVKGEPLCLELMKNPTPNLSEAKTASSIYDSRRDDDTAVTRLQRVVVMVHTFGRIVENKYTDCRGITHDLKIQSLKNLMFSSAKSLFTHCAAARCETKVSVVNKDCLECAQETILRKSVSSGRSSKNPVKVGVLNMANEERRGGGYLSGALAQEEELMRRTTLCVALDTEVYDQYVSMRGQQPLQTQIDRVPYPWKTFFTDLVVTEGVVAFKSTAADEYAFLNDPFTITVFSTAASNLKGRDMEEKDVELLSNRIHTLFRAAIDAKITTLVLSALGCGAFHNPAPEVVQVFLSVIKSYAGCFDEIIFSILSNDTSKNSNYYVFFDALDGVVIETPAVDPIRCFPLCLGCESTSCDATHMHYPLCNCTVSYKDMPLAHRLCFRHVCPQAAICVSNDRRHLMMFSHLHACENGKSCPDFSAAHCSLYSHPPLCSEGYLCPHKDDHRHYFRHEPKARCAAGTFCTMFDLERHGQYLVHTQKSDNRPVFSVGVAENNEGNSLVCYWGMQCKHLKVPADRMTPETEKHLDTYYHLYRPACQDGDTCHSMLNDQHMMQYSHPDVADFRPACRDDLLCTKKDDLAHCSKYSHRVSHLKICLRSGVPIVMEKRVDYFNNLLTLKKDISSLDVDPASYEVCFQFVRNARPVHRCNGRVFASVLNHGYLMSLKRMQKLNDYDEVSQQAKLHYILSKEKTPNKREVLSSYLAEMTRHQCRLKDDSKANDDSVLKAKHLLRKVYTTAADTWIEQLDDVAKGLAETSRELFNMANGTSEERGPGIGYSVDKTLGTDDTIFAILGPNTFWRYGCVHVVLSRTAMFHIDYYNHVSAATLYYSQDSISNRSYLKLPGAAHEPKRVHYYYNHTLHPAVADSEEVLARDLAGVIMSHLRKKKLTMDDVLTAVLGKDHLDAHFLIECHLPSRVPLNMISAVVFDEETFTDMPKNKIQDLKDAGVHVFIEKTQEAATKRAHDLSLKPHDYLEKSMKGFTFAFSDDEYTIPMSIPGGDSNVFLSFEMLGRSMVLGLTSETWTDLPPMLCVFFYAKEVAVIRKNNETMKFLAGKDENEIKRVLFGPDCIASMSWPEVESGKYRTFQVGLVDHRSKLVVIRKGAPLACRHICVDIGSYGSHVRGVQLATNSQASKLSVVNFRLLTKEEAEAIDIDDPEFDMKCGPRVPRELRARESARINAAKEKGTAEAHRQRQRQDPRGWPAVPGGDSLDATYNLVPVPLGGEPAPQPQPRTKYQCKYGAECRTKTAEHLAKYYHPGDGYVEGGPQAVPAVVYAGETPSKKKELCKYGSSCYNKDPAHLAKYDHPKEGEDESVPKYQKEISKAQKVNMDISKFVIEEKKPDIDTSAVFVMDVTGSMSELIKSCSESIVSISKEIQASAVKSADSAGYNVKNLKASFAFVGYRDIGDEGHPVTIPFGKVDELSKSIGDVKATGGGDYPEDMCTGLDAALKLPWPPGNRMLFVVADAPNHGAECFSTTQGRDDHKETDQNGIKWAERWKNIAREVRAKGISCLVLMEAQAGCLNMTYDYLVKLLDNKIVQRADLKKPELLKTMVTSSATKAYDKFLKDLE